MGCSIDLGRIQFNHHHLFHINTNSINQRKIRPPCLNVKHPYRHHVVVRRVSCSAVDEEQIQEVSFSDAENSLISSLIGIEGRGRSASPQQLKVTF